MILTYKCTCTQNTQLYPVRAKHVKLYEQTSLQAILSRSNQTHDAVSVTGVSVKSLRCRGGVKIAGCVELHEEDLRCRVRVVLYGSILWTKVVVHVVYSIYFRT
jgi:hypothetical protein